MTKAIPPELVHWLTEKAARHRWAGVVETRTIVHEWHRQGGRMMSAGLSVSVAPSQDFKIAVDAAGISQDYVSGATNGVITVLMSQGWSPVLACSVRLFDFRPHEIESSYASFYAAGKEAMERLLGIGEDTKHNIAW